MGELDKLRDAREKMSQYFPLTQGAVVIFMLVWYKYVKHYQKMNISMVRQVDNTELIDKD